MNIRIVQWNISNKSKTEKITEYLKSTITETPSVLCLSEVTPSAFPLLKDALSPTNLSYSLDYRPPGGNEGRNRTLGILICTFGADITSSKLLDRTVFPERTLCCSVRTSTIKFKVVAFHSLTGVDYKKAKSSNFATIADFLETHQDIDFLCFDSNEPKIDSIDPSKRVFFKNCDGGRSAALLLGVDPVHNLQDSYVQYLKSQGDVDDRDPLAVSYRTGKSGPNLPPIPL